MPWIFQIVGPIAWFAIAGLLLWQSRKNKALTFFAITFFAATTMWWQEWYADWAGYLRFSGEFALIPWYATTWAAPTKPWAVIAGYGWFIPPGHSGDRATGQPRDPQQSWICPLPRGCGNHRTDLLGDRYHRRGDPPAR